MHHRLIILFAVIGAVFCSGQSYAQLYEDNCYFPQFGKPGEIDTVYGDHVGQMLGSDVFNPGPFDKYTDGKIFIQGLPQNPPFLSAVDPKPPFDVHKFTIQKKLAFQRYGLTGDFAHLHDSKHWDFYGYDQGSNTPRIYWSDEDGNYDSTRVTYFALPKRPRRTFELTLFNNGLACVGNFTSDTVKDLILGVAYGTFFPPDTNSYYVALFRGGQNLFSQGDTAYCDSLRPVNSFTNTPNELIVGQFREKGKDDIIGFNYNGDCFYYKNDPPFSLKNFWNSMLFDTLLTRWQNPSMDKNNGGTAARLFPKSGRDSSDDLDWSFLLTSNPVNDLEFFYKGGKDFGSKRLFVDSADFVFHSPRYYSSSLFGFYVDYIRYVGDLTGTGNPVYRSYAALDNYAYEFYYVMGKALNDHVDMSFRPEPGGIGNIATLHVNADGKTDLIEGMPYFTSESDLAKGEQNFGLLALIYGSSKIPVNLNPKFAVKERNDVDVAINHIVAYPNPCGEKTVLTFDNCSSSEMRVQVYSATGVLVQQEETPAMDGLQQYAIYLSSLAPGMYVVRLSCPALGWTGSVNVIKTGATQTPRSFDLKKMVGR